MLCWSPKVVSSDVRVLVKSLYMIPAKCYGHVIGDCCKWGEGFYFDL